MSKVAALDAVEHQRLSGWLAEVGHGVAGVLDAILPAETPGANELPLWACMRYATLAGGKRLRPALVLAAYEVAGGTVRERPLWCGAALEMLHTYSLIQDDLPCMDNDDLRRGQPTAHKKFDEATAILASDGLQTGAFEVLTDARVHPDAAVRLDVLKLVAQANGARGMVAGQVVDMQWETTKPSIDAEQLAHMNHLKTGVVIRAAVLAGAILAQPKGEAGAALRAALDDYATHLGRAFQVWDDVLDVTANAATLGKTPGKDAKAGKTTFVSLLGVDGATARAQTEAAAALAALEPLGDKVELLCLIARYAVTREK